MPLGALVRLIPFELDEVPPHPSIVSYLGRSDDPETDLQRSEVSSHDGTSLTQDPNRQPELKSFIKEILDEAINFVDNDVPETFKKKGTKSNPPSTAKVEVLQRMISSEEVSRIPFQKSKSRRISGKTTQKAGEAWFARKSTHANKPEYGTATWDEFDAGLRERHSENEREYAPDVFDSFRVLDWDRETEGFGGELGGGYSDVTMSVYEMAHELPGPLLPRVFRVLIVTAKTGSDGFIVVQIPINPQTLPESFYSSGRNQTEGDTAVKRKRPVFGIYTSIERCILMDSDEIDWVMATASDAGGYLPMWAQKLGMPGAICNDVGLFMKWTAGKRSS